MPTRKRILLIDDEPRLTAVVSAALQATGRYLLQQTNYNAGAVREAIEFQPDLIVVDAKPEQLEVDVVAKKIHCESSLEHVPVVCLTNLEADGQIGTVGFLAGYTFFANAFHLEDMVNCIGEILRVKRSRNAR
jgi:DNA-binding response OmpR family regulator